MFERLHEGGGVRRGGDMYGFFNHAFEKFIIHKYGIEKWEIIRMEAGMFDDSFDDKTLYDDNMTYEIIDAACYVLDMENEELQEVFGETYFNNCLSTHHSRLLSKLGGNLYDFLANMDTLHDHISLSYAGVKIPSFRVKEDSRRGTIYVDYYTERVGLEYVTKGVIREAAKQLFDLDVLVQSMVDVNKFTFLVTSNDPDKCSKMFPERLHSSRDLIPQANVPKVSPLEFTKAFPFHMIFDREMNFVQKGTTLMRILKEANCDKVTSYFKLSRPNIDFDFDSIHARLNNAFVLTSLNDAVKLDLSSMALTSRRSNIRLKGEMIHLEEPDLMLFLCSPIISNIEDMRNKGLCLSDIPIHDATRDLVLLSENFQKELEMTHQLGIVSDHLQKIHNELEEEMNLYDRLLFDVLPPMVARDLREFNPVPTEKFESVTLLFSGIVNFSTLCQDLNPFDIVSMLNELYTRYDTLLDHLSNLVYKVETVGDKYMAASGLPERCSNHAEVVCALALDMIDATKKVNINNSPLQVTIGVHSGEVVAGVIGQRLPRYCLFGNVVNLTSRTETTGVKGKINVTEEAYSLLRDDADFHEKFKLTKRGEVEMKGRAKPMTTYLLERVVSERITSSPDSNSSTEQTFLLPSTSPQGLVVTTDGSKEHFTLNRVRSIAPKRSMNHSLN